MELRERLATRTVLLDEAGRVALLKVEKLDYYKVPGGGVDEGEDTATAAKREVREEAGCDCEIVAPLGELVTEIPGWGNRDTSVGYLAKVVGEKGTPQYEDYENERGFGLIWAESLPAAIELLENHAVLDPDAKLLQGRDLAFLRRAQEYLSQAD